MDTYQEEMLCQFLINDMVIKEYAALMSDTTNPVHITRKILSAVNDSKVQTVRVTILKDGHRVSFKTSANDFRRDCKGGYGHWHMPKRDRLNYELQFGNSPYLPEEILSITYGQRVLYSAEEE